MKEIKISELKKAYDNNTVVEAAAILGISTRTLDRLVKESGIPRKGKGNPNAKGGGNKVILIDDMESEDESNSN